MDITGIGSIANLGGKIIDKIWPSPEDESKRTEAKAKLLQAQQSGDLETLDKLLRADKAQAEVNAVEAKSDEVFVSGWRPYIGWICGTGLGINYIVIPVGVFVARFWQPDFIAPELDFSAMMPVMLGMLGLGGMRSWEKLKGVSNRSVGH